MDLLRRFRRSGDKQSRRDSAASFESLTPAMPPLEVAGLIQRRLGWNRTYARQQRGSWRLFASATKIITLLLSASATVILGVAQLDGLATVGFVLTALVTTVSAIEPYFNWRSRWVAAEEALAIWYQLEENLVNYVAKTKEAELDIAELMKIDDARQAAWENFSQEWLRARRASEARTPAG